MPYYIAKTIDQPFEDAIEAAEAALKKEGFGVLTRIDIADTLKKKIGAEFHPYVILGACNPQLAFEALKLENKVGTMLPCNVVVQAVADNRSEVAAIDPVASMQAIDNADLKGAAEQVRAKLARVIDSL
ncbi:DUF302 domain-containing protein [Stakelama sediminis]|uniref:Uncharacterized protein (DUF302 family) n=1 Tax=Stakelama sediminis TaxID=463200 RepID=A0A840Z0F8_9SPHN|nr:DUF302 domain-containing protein [Stakelama sediminis]MBB5719601.1 uncharacterized protein (DUF302 family) [Stakelama sediminis]